MVWMTAPEHFCLCLKFYSPSASSNLNEPAQSACPQRRLSRGFHYDIRVKRMARRLERNMGSMLQGEVQQIEGHEEGFDLWDFFWLTQYSSTDLFLVLTRHRFSFLLFLFEMWQTSRPGFCSVRPTPSSDPIQIVFSFYGFMKVQVALEKCEAYWYFDFVTKLYCLV